MEGAEIDGGDPQVNIEVDALTSPIARFRVSASD